MLPGSDTSLCKRVEMSRGRYDAIFTGLVEEYLLCFSRENLTDRQVQALNRCIESAIILAHATTIPILFYDAVCQLQGLHPVILTVCAHFFRHLRHSWFSLENPLLDDMYKEIRKLSL